MSATMLQLVQQASVEMGLASPSTVAGNTTQNVVQTLGLLNAVGYELQRQWQWQAQTVPYTFSTPFFTYTATLSTSSTTITALSSTVGLTATPTYFQVTGTGIPQNTYLVSVGVTTAVLTNTPTTAGTAVSLTFSQVKFAMPSDFDRLIDRTDWDKSQHWEMLGPETAQQWQWLTSGYISSGPRVRYRVLGGTFTIWPPLGANHQLGFEYVSNLWVTATGGTTPTKSAFTVDTDTCIFPDRLMVLGVKLKYFEIKGFETTAFYRDYTAQLDMAKAFDAGSPTLSFAPRQSSVLIGFENIPDSNYGS